jgi:transcriptional regulator with XRE-family HTH domain
MTSVKLLDAENSSPASPQLERLGFGERIKALRSGRKWTLANLSQRCGIALSTISKAERGVISLTYDNILKLAYGFGMEMSELLSESDNKEISEIVTVERKNIAQRLENQYYIMNMLCSSRTKKRMMPVLATIKAHSIQEFSRFIRHPGEEFVYILEGELTFQIDGQLPRVLGPGDSIYFDSALGHAYVSSGEVDARLIVVCWHPLPNDLEQSSSKDIHPAM